MSLFTSARNALARTFATRYKTMFGTARVYEPMWHNTRIRVLDLGHSYQSATFLDERWCDLPFPYLEQYDRIFDANRPMRDLCMLGGGGYAYPKHVIAHYPDARIDVVEIDPQITAIARRHFFLDRLEHTYLAQQKDQLGLVCDDALNHLTSCVQRGRTYDAILNDCFAGTMADDALTTNEAIRLARACLTPDGMYLTNVIGTLEGPLADDLMGLAAILSTEFAHVMAFPCQFEDHTESNNIMVLATNGSHEPSGAIRLVDTAC